MSIQMSKLSTCYLYDSFLARMNLGKDLAEVQGRCYSLLLTNREHQWSWWKHRFKNDQWKLKKSMKHVVLSTAWDILIQQMGTVQPSKIAFWVVTKPRLISLIPAGSLLCTKLVCDPPLMTWWMLLSTVWKSIAMFYPPGSVTVYCYAWGTCQSMIISNLKSRCFWETPYGRRIFDRLSHKMHLENVAQFNKMVKYLW